MVLGCWSVQKVLCIINLGLVGVSSLIRIKHSLSAVVNELTKKSKLHRVMLFCFRVWINNSPT